MLFYEAFFPVVWIVFVLYWQIKAADTKATQRLEPAASRILRVLIFLIAIVLLSIPRIPLPWLYVQFWPAGYWPFWLGAAITVAGLLFAVWAREHLGRNWSRSVTIKQGHELITPAANAGLSEERAQDSEGPYDLMHSRCSRQGPLKTPAAEDHSTLSAGSDAADATLVRSAQTPLRMRSRNPPFRRHAKSLR